jgi:hypothetical protein
MAMAYCGLVRTAPNYSGEREASFGVNANHSNSPLVAVCAGAP